MATTQVDEDWGEEIALYILNDSQLYRTGTTAFIMNYARKKVKGTYDRTLAIKGLEILVKRGMEKYARDFRIPWKQMLNQINVPTRRYAAKEILNHITDEINEKTKQMRALKKAGKPWTMQGR